MSLTASHNPSGGPYRRAPQQRGRRFVFTLNNWTQSEYSLVTSSAFTAKVQWMVVAKETGESRTAHLQGAFICKTQMAFSTVKKWPGLARAHLETMKGTPQDSLVYCSKEDSQPFVFGTLPSPGKRNDLATVAEMIVKEGLSMREIAREGDIGSVAIVKFHKGLTVLRSLTRPPRTEPPKIFWLHGPTGAGKTRGSWEHANRLGDVWLSSGGLRWFDGYDGQRSAIFDDFRSKGVSFPFLLRVLDRYPMQVEFKGGYVEWTPEFIFITAPGHPDDVFAKRKEHLPEDINQLLRRITQGGGGIFQLPGDQDDFDCTLEKFTPLPRDTGELQVVAPPDDQDDQPINLNGFGFFEDEDSFNDEDFMN